MEDVSAAKAPIDMITCACDSVPRRCGIDELTCQSIGYGRLGTQPSPRAANADESGDSRSISSYLTCDYVNHDQSGAPKGHLAISDGGRVVCVP